MVFGFITSRVRIMNSLEIETGPAQGVNLSPFRSLIDDWWGTVTKRNAMELPFLD